MRGQIPSRRPNAAGSNQCAILYSITTNQAAIIALFRVMGGAAFTRDRLDANNGLPGALAGSATGSFDRTGWLAGVGVEWAFLQKWSVKAEYNYMGFGSIT
jgi:opacity protein-like surface antigen